MKTLMVFYSLDGNTKFIADAIAGKLGADVMEIKTQKTYPTEGFMKYFTGGKSVILGECPKLINESMDFGNYGNIIIGTPIWAGSYSAPINTFLKQNKIENKKIALFACHTSKSADAAQKCFKNFKAKLAGNTFLGETDFIDPLSHNKEYNLKKAEEWAAGLDLT